MTLSDELAKLRDRYESVVEENRWLKEQLNPPGFLPASFPLSEREEQLFKLLITRPQWTREALCNAIYINEPDEDMPDLRMIDVLVCKIRRKLKPFEIEIKTYWGKGFGMSEAMRQRAQRIIADEIAKEAAA